MWLMLLYKSYEYNRLQVILGLERVKKIEEKNSDLVAIDEAVYTWVDDCTPGYADNLRQFANNDHDLDPNRTRDNLDLLRFSFRSLEAYAPWVKKITLVTARPQVPEWLDTSHPHITLVHHDEFIPGERLPTFNSFAILSHLHLLPNAPEQFLYFEDDIVLTAPTSPRHFVDAGGKIRIYPRGSRTPNAKYPRRPEDSPWNRALSFTNEVLDQTYDRQERPYVGHVPMVLRPRKFAEIWDRFNSYLVDTGNSKFRSGNNIVMEHFYPYVLLADGEGVKETVQSAKRACKYLGLENYPLWNDVHLWYLARNPGQILTLNDNFGAAPRANIVKSVKSWLLKRYPQRSRFES